MDDEDSAGDDVQSILTYGAKALFEEGGQGAHDITCLCFQFVQNIVLTFSIRFRERHRETYRENRNRGRSGRDREERWAVVLLRKDMDCG